MSWTGMMARRCGAFAPEDALGSRTPTCMLMRDHEGPHVALVHGDSDVLWDGLGFTPTPTWLIVSWEDPATDAGVPGVTVRAEPIQLEPEPPPVCPSCLDDPGVSFCGHCGSAVELVMGPTGMQLLREAPYPARRGLLRRAARVLWRTVRRG